MPRLFSGLEIPAQLTETLALLRGGLMGARWIDPENYHLTLRFFGEVDYHQANDLADMLAEIQCEPFTLTLDKLGTFGKDRPRTLFAGFQPQEALDHLHAQHERIARKAGLKAVSRKFTPHITLARLRDISSLTLAHYLAQHDGFVPRTITINHVTLFSSRPGGGGPYRREEHYPALDHPAHDWQESPARDQDMAENWHEIDEWARLFNEAGKDANA